MVDSTATQTFAAPRSGQTADILKQLENLAHKISVLGSPFGSVQVLVNPDTPKFQISPECPLTDNFRTEMNAWCTSFFGTTNLVADDKFLPIPGSYEGSTVFLVNPRTFARLRNLPKKDSPHLA